MNVINFSGGGPETDPAQRRDDRRRSRTSPHAGVVPVIAAGNDRDDFGLGTVGSPGSAPDAITVAAVSNSHFFGRQLDGRLAAAPVSSSELPDRADVRRRSPASWVDTPQTLVDVGRLKGTNGKPVDRHLCGPASDPNLLQATLPAGRAQGQDRARRARQLHASVSRRTGPSAAGAIGVIVIDNRPGDPNPIPVAFGFPMAMISDLDGTAPRDRDGGDSGGQATIRSAETVLEIQTNRPGVIGELLVGRPDRLRAPAQARHVGARRSRCSRRRSPSSRARRSPSSTARAWRRRTSRARRRCCSQRHPGWTPKQVKSALMSTAGPAFADTLRTKEAPVLEEGAGSRLARRPRTTPLVFTDPQSLSLGELDVNAGAQSRRLVLSVSDAGGGDGTWQVEVHPQTVSAGASLDVQPLVTLTPAGSAMVSVTARASADAAAGDDGGFLVLQARQRHAARPLLLLRRPGPGSRRRDGLDAEDGPDRRHEAGDEPRDRLPLAAGAVRPGAELHRPADGGGRQGARLRDDDPRGTLNFGAAVEPQSGGSLVEPWLLGALDENTVQGYAGTPVNMNGILLDYKGDVGAAGAVFPKAGRYYFSVDSQLDPYTRKSLAGSYVLRSWVNDSTPPRVTLLTTRVAAGRPTIALRARDSQSGVDPYSILVGYGNQLAAAAAYDSSPGSS